MITGHVKSLHAIYIFWRQPLVSYKFILMLEKKRISKTEERNWYLHLSKNDIQSNHIAPFPPTQAIYVPADDLTDPAPATTFAHLDATTVLSRGIAELGIYPAVDPLDSSSRILDPNIVGHEHYACARGVQKILQDYKSLQVTICDSEILGKEMFVSGSLPVR